MLSPSPPDGDDRRSCPRFPMPVGRLAGEIQGATLLNLSRKGMAIVAPLTSTLYRGAVYRLTLLDLESTVEVEGQVRWLRSDAKQQSEAGGDQPIQIAGLSFRRILTAEPRGTWRQLIADPGPLGEKSTESKPLRVIEMVTPLDGIEVDDPSVLVTCRLRTPEEVASVGINGVEADRIDDKVMATVDLEPGLNSLRALIWRQDGSYRSYFLGRVDRQAEARD